jgi:AAA+ superfamily predicted ATPase
MELTPYVAASEVLADRVRWTMSTLAALVNRGRAEGWLDGAPLDTQELDAVSLQIVRRTELTGHLPLVLPMEWMALRLGLDGRELAVLWLLACLEISPAAARLARALGSPEHPELSVQLLRQLVLVTDSELDRLERFGLLELPGDPRIPQHRRAIRANDRVIALARGELELDRELTGLAELHGIETSPPVVVPSCFVEGLDARPTPVLVAVGPTGAGRTTLLAAAAARAGRGTLRVRASRLSDDAVSVRRTLRALLREARLFGVCLLLQDLESTSERVVAELERELAEPGVPVMISSTSVLRLSSCPSVVHRLDKPDVDERRRQWAAAIDAAPEVVEWSASQYTLWPGAIAAAARNARALVGANRPVTSDAIHAGLRTHLGEQLEGLATRIDVRQSWADLVLPPDQLEQLRELVARVRHRAQVLDGWGFRDKVGRGHGVAALLSGPPGTGKTMIAGIVARELGLDLYQVDLSKVVSKYIGETEKQLAAAFDAAESGQVILLFDEADALFAKRSEVKSSNDRYANLEVNFLLQRMEAFTGVTLLTTNHEHAIDEAFRRRLAVHIRLPLPDEEQRHELWNVLIPPQASRAPRIDFERLAREFEMSGGYIKNAVLRAAYMAAEEGAMIDESRLWRAARAEYESIGKLTFRSV